MKEIWRDVVGYEGIYQVSTYGNVRSIHGKMLSPHIIGDHAAVWLYKECKRSKRYVHRLVAEAFIENNCNGTVVNHKDENGLNNFVENLEWCSSKYNTNYGTCIERRAEKAKKDIQQCSLSGVLIKNWHGIIEAASELHIDPSSITKAARRKRKSAGGYIWRYLDDG